MQGLSETSERVVYMLEYATDFAVFFKESDENGDDLCPLKGNAFFSKTRLRERVICSILSIVME